MHYLTTSLPPSSGWVPQPLRSRDLWCAPLSFRYGVPIFLPNGNVNPAYLAAERKEMAAQSKRNMIATENKCARADRTGERDGVCGMGVVVRGGLRRADGARDGCARATGGRSSSPTSSSSSRTTSARRSARSARARTTTSRAAKRTRACRRRDAARGPCTPADARRHGARQGCASLLFCVALQKSVSGGGLGCV